MSTTSAHCPHGCPWGRCLACMGSVEVAPRALLDPPTRTDLAPGTPETTERTPALEERPTKRYGRWWYELRHTRDTMPGNERCVLEAIFSELGEQSREIASIRTALAAERAARERAEGERDEDSRLLDTLERVAWARCVGIQPKPVRGLRTTAAFHIHLNGIGFLRRQGSADFATLRDALRTLAAHTPEESDGEQ